VRPGCTSFCCTIRKMTSPTDTMPECRRPFVSRGATLFFTVVTHNRRPILNGSAIDLLRTAFREERDHHPLKFGDAVEVAAGW